MDWSEQDNVDLDAKRKMGVLHLQRLPMDVLADIRDDKDDQRIVYFSVLKYPLFTPGFRYSQFSSAPGDNVQTPPYWEDPTELAWLMQAIEDEVKRREVEGIDW